MSINENVSSSCINKDNDNHLSDHLRHQNSSLLLNKKSSWDNSKTCSDSIPSRFSNIEQERLSAAYTSLFTSASNGKNILPMNIDPSVMRVALIQREHFINSLGLLQQNKKMLDNNDVQINKTLKTKFKEIFPINREETKRIKLENLTSFSSNSSISSSIKSNNIKREKQSSSSTSNGSNK